ncbi:ABC transporter substrate-binding protein [Pseudogemmobacter sonorensis]|uniref:ABC transporter substrate-binding protein n=1 Tax=Pseudogemmobacter sonorensis TaxID=2989681 RepID=UPI00369E9E06
MDLKHPAAFFAGLALAALVPALAAAETIRIAKQPGVAYLPLMVMEYEGLLEKHSQAAGLEVDTQWLRFTGGSAMNEALLSGNLDIAAGGIPPLLTIWSRTQNNLAVKGLVAVSSQPQYLLSTNPDVKTISDFSSADKIALPAVKVSNQAVMIQMAAARELGEDKALSIDPFTVSMGHPDALAALLAGSDINGHFSQSPFQDIALRDPRVHIVLDSFDAVGGSYPVAVMYATTPFTEKNPEIAAAFVAAMQEAQSMIAADRDYAVKVWFEMDNVSLTEEEAHEVLSNPRMGWDAAPQSTMTFMAHMAKVGLIGRTAEDWRDIYFPWIHALSGS